MGTIPLKSTSNNYGLGRLLVSRLRWLALHLSIVSCAAVSADGAELYVSNWNSYEVTVHSASTLMFMRSFGTEAAATGVAKVCLVSAVLIHYHVES